MLQKRRFTHLVQEHNAHDVGHIIIYTKQKRCQCDNHVGKPGKVVLEIRHMYKTILIFQFSPCRVSCHANTYVFLAGRMKSS